jgi:hypothetical protein
MDMLAVAINGREVRKMLQNLPKSTDNVYNESMERVDGQLASARELAALVFSWIVHSFRTLSLKELQYALAISSDCGMGRVDPTILVDVYALTSACAGLVVVDTKFNTVRLVRK